MSRVNAYMYLITHMHACTLVYPRRKKTIWFWTKSDT